jgi:hypothetical protein
MNRDQIINLIQSIGKIAGASAATYGAQAQNLTVAVFGAVTALLSFLWSHSSNATRPTPPSKQIPLLLFFAGLSLAGTGCTRFVVATGQNKVITTISSTCFGINVQAATAANQTPAIQLGLIRQTVQFMPCATNAAGTNGGSVIQAPDYASVFDIQQGVDPFSFDGAESFTSGHVASYEPSAKTNTVLSIPARPQ